MNMNNNMNNNNHDADMDEVNGNGNGYQEDDLMMIDEKTVMKHLICRWWARVVQTND